MSENLWSLANDALQRHANHLAWVRRVGKGKREEYTYRQIHCYALNIARRLRKLGVEAGDRIGVLSANGPEWGASAFAAWKLGAVITPLHIGNSDEELKTQAQALAPKLILYHGTDRGLKNTEVIELDDAVDGSDDASVSPAKSSDEAVRIYTSGSTGNPKMVKLSHNNIMSNVLAAANIDLHISSNDRFLSLLPLSHAMELTGGMLLPLHQGSTIVLPRVLAAHEILEAMVDEKITLVIAVPRLFRNIMLNMKKRFKEGGTTLGVYLKLLRLTPLGMRRMLNWPIRRKVGGNIKCWLSGGSRLDPEIGQFFRDLGLPLIQGYGLTECSPVVSVQEQSDPLVDSVGKPLPGVTVKIHAADANGAGELWVSGPNVMMGYVDEVQTRETMENDWYKTGDIARLVDGKIIITGRSKRLIVTESGKNVYPEDLEVLLERDPELKEAGVLEVDMRPAAVLAIDPPDQNARAKEIVKKFNARVSSHNQIVRYAVVEELPRTPLGKVALKDLPKIFEQFEIRKN